MSRIVLLTLAFTAALAAAQLEGSGLSNEEDAPLNRNKREDDGDNTPSVGIDEGREENRRHRDRDNSDSNDDDNDDDNDRSNDHGDESDEPRLLPPNPVGFPPQVQPIPVGFQPQSLQPAPVGAQPFPIGAGAQPLPLTQPISLPVAAQEGTGLVEVEEVPVLPQPAAQIGNFGGRPGSNFPPTTTTTTTTTTTPAPAPRPVGGLIPSATLTCSSVRCPSGSVCRMENNRFSRREEPVCVFNGANSQTSCTQVRCSDGFNCEMQQINSCSRLPCPLNPVCVQAPVTSAPVPSCNTVRCSEGTLCRLQPDERCTIAPCAILPTCVSPCSSVTCPSNSQCNVNTVTLATACVPNVPAQSPASCNGVRCGFGERCAIVKNCNFIHGCKDEAKCGRF